MKNYIHFISLHWRVAKRKTFKFTLTIFNSLILLSAYSVEANPPSAPTNLHIITEITISGSIFRGDDTTKAARTITVGAYETSNTTPISSFTTPTGFYTLKVPVGFTGSIKPTAADTTFSPASIAFTSGAAVNNNNFAALYNIYVAKTGNDSNSGTEASPFLNIQAAERIVYPGDNVYIKAGTYIASDVGCGTHGCGFWDATPILKVTRDGTQNRPILFEAFGNDIVTIDGRGINKTGISIESNYITVSKLIAINAKGAGIRIWASWLTTGSPQPTKGPPVLTGTSTGRKVTGSRVVECIVHDNSKSLTGFESGIQVLGQVDNCIIEKSISFRNGNGIGLRERPSILTFRDYNIPEYRNPWPDAPRNCVIRKNIAYNNTKVDENTNGICSGYNTNMLYEDNITFNNVDDNICDLAAVNTSYIGNVSFNSNPSGTLDGDGNGLKVTTRGGGGNTIRNNIAFLNPRAGFDDDDGIDNIYQNNTAYRNAIWGMLIESDKGAHTFQNNLSYLNGADVSLSIDCPNAPPFTPHETDYNYWGDGKPPLNACGKSPYNDANSLSNTSTAYGLNAMGSPAFVNPIDDISELDLSGLDTVKPGEIGTLADYILKQVRAAFTLQSSSQLIDKGTVVGLPFNSTTPDIGAIEAP